MSEEAAILARLKPCVDGPITGDARADILSGRASHYPSTRAVLEQIIDGRKHRTGRPSKLDRQAELLNRFRASRDHMPRDDAKQTLRPAFSDLSDGEFEAATCAKPSGRIVQRAREVEGGKTFTTVYSNRTPT